MPTPTLRLQYGDVTLVNCPTNAHEQRWTLGPTWYDENADEHFGDPHLPYAHASAGLEEARIWAAKIIRDTTNYVISAWAKDGVTAILTPVVDSLLIVTVDGQRFNFDLPSARNATRAIEELYRTGGIINVRRTPSENTIETVYIPTHSIASFIHRTRTVQEPTS